MLRTATSSDLPQLLVIEEKTQLAPWSKETFEKCFQVSSHGWVIEQAASKIIGFILVLMQASECHILNVCVDPDYQRQGYGQQLLFHALRTAKQQGTGMAYLEVRASNEQARALYRKTGFEKIGERKNYYSTSEGREDAWVFAKNL